MKGFSNKTLTKRLKKLDKNRILGRQGYKEIPSRKEYRLATKGQEFVESINNYQ